MYDELIKMLRTCSERDSCIGWEKACPYLRTRVCNNKAEKAADAIEELKQITTHYEEESKGWWLAACDAKEERERLKDQLDNAEIENIKLREEFARYRGKHRWIPVKERLPEKNQEVLIFLFGEDPYIAWHNGEYWCTEDFRLDEPDDWQPTHWFPLPKHPESEGEP